MNAATVRHVQLVQSLSKQLKIPRQTVEKVMGGMVAALGPELKNGKRVQIKGLGMLTVREVRAADGGTAKKRVVLVAGKELKAAAGA